MEFLIKLSWATPCTSSVPVSVKTVWSRRIWSGGWESEHWFRLPFLHRAKEGKGFTSHITMKRNLGNRPPVSCEIGQVI